MPIADDVKLGAGVQIHHPELVNLYGCTIGADSSVGPFVEIQRGVRDGRLLRDGDWPVIPTLVQRGASIGSGAVILCGVTIGEGASIGAGAVVTASVASGATVAGVPARVIARVEK